MAGSVCRYKYDGAQWLLAEDCGAGTCPPASNLDKIIPNSGDPIEFTIACGSTHIPMTNAAPKSAKLDVTKINVIKKHP
jgi:hypothetical protein